MRHAPTTHYRLLAALDDRDGEARQSAWHDFAMIYEPAILGFVKHLGMQHSDCIDIVQDVLCQVQKYSQTSKLPTQDFRPWLAKVTRTKVIDLIRKNKRYAKLLQSYANNLSADADEALHLQWELEVQQTLFSIAAKQVQLEVNEKQWLAFWLTAIELQPAHAVSTKLEMSIGSIYVAKCRIMDRIREIVKRTSFEGCVPQARDEEQSWSS